MVIFSRLYKMLKIYEKEIGSKMLLQYEVQNGI